mgnify:CR=1 FL=1
MLVKRWNGNSYEDAEIKDDIYIAITENMESLTTCPGCGRKVEFGATYTSKEYFFPSGVFGMSVCEACHRKEWEALYKHE